MNATNTERRQMRLAAESSSLGGSRQAPWLVGLVMGDEPDLGVELIRTAPTQ
jgi:hypothetical protein